MLSNVQQTLRRSPLVYGALFAVVPVVLGVVVGSGVGFGPCGPNVPSSIRLVVLAAGIAALAAPLIGGWLFWHSFSQRGVVTTLIAVPLLAGSVLVCLYWLPVIVSAVMG